MRAFLCLSFLLAAPAILTAQAAPQTQLEEEEARVQSAPARSILALMRPANMPPALKEAEGQIIAAMAALAPESSELPVVPIAVNDKYVPPFSASRLRQPAWLSQFDRVTGVNLLLVVEGDDLRGTPVVRFKIFSLAERREIQGVTVIPDESTDWADEIGRFWRDFWDAFLEPDGMYADVQAQFQERQRWLLSNVILNPAEQPALAFLPFAKLDDLEGFSYLSTSLMASLFNSVHQTSMPEQYAILPQDVVISLAQGVGLTSYNVGLNDPTYNFFRQAAARWIVSGHYTVDEQDDALVVTIYVFSVEYGSIVWSKTETLPLTGSRLLRGLDELAVKVQTLFTELPKLTDCAHLTALVHELQGDSSRQVVAVLGSDSELLADAVSRIRSDPQAELQVLPVAVVNAAAFAALLDFERVGLNIPTYEFFRQVRASLIVIPVEREGNAIRSKVFHLHSKLYLDPVFLEDDATILLETPPSAAPLLPPRCLPQFVPEPEVVAIPEPAPREPEPTPDPPLFSGVVSLDVGVSPLIGGLSATSVITAPFVSPRLSVVLQARFLPDWLGLTLSAQWFGYGSAEFVTAPNQQTTGLSVHAFPLLIGLDARGWLGQDVWLGGQLAAGVTLQAYAIEALGQSGATAVATMDAAVLAGLRLNDVWGLQLRIGLSWLYDAASTADLATWLFVLSPSLGVTVSI